MVNKKNMYSSFDTLLMNIWRSLDDIFLCIGVFIVARVVAYSCYWCLHIYFNVDEYESEFIQYGFLGTILVFLISHLFGETAVASLLGGFSIGIGYAFQPYIISFLSGSTLRATNTLSHGTVILFTTPTGITRLTVRQLGLLHICVSNGDTLTYIPNSYFQTTPLTIENPVL